MRNMLKRIFAFLLAMVLLVGAIPMASVHVHAEDAEEMILEEPELTKKGGSFCVRLKASAPTLHIIRSDVTTEITPLMGCERQCEDLVRYMRDKFEANPLAMWEYDIFGKSLHDLVRENMEGKLQKMPENVQRKLQEAVRRITNDGSGGLICIII